MLLIISCSKEKPDTVAKIGDERISFKKFEQSFTLNPKYAIRTPLSKARRSQLQHLINEKYYYLSAKEVDLQKDSVIQRKINYIKNQETIKAYLQETFLDKIKIDNEEIIKAFAKIDKKIKVHHLFVKSLEEAKALEKKLSNGESFSQLAKEIYKDEYLQESGGEIGFVGFGDLDSAIEDKVFSLNVNEISKPVRSAYGYHIVKVTEIGRNENYINMQMATKMDLIKKALKNRYAAEMILPHLKKLSGNNKIQVNNRALDVLVAATEGVMGNRYTEQNLLKPPIRTGDIYSIEVELKDKFEMDLARFGNREITIYGFLDRIKEMPPYHRPYLSGHKRMAQSIIDVIRDDLLLKDAIKNGFDDNKTVKEKSEEYIEELLADEFKKLIHSKYFMKKYSGKWNEYNNTLNEIKENTTAKVFEENLFADVSNPDSILTPPPIQIFLKNRYVW